MNTACETIRARLLEADDPHPDHCDRPDIAPHLAACDACRVYALRLAGVEAAVRGIPTPAVADLAKAAFLRKHAVISPAPASTSSTPSLKRWSLAAAFAVMLGTAALLLVPGQSAMAAPAVVERLVDWNVRLSGAGTRGEREELFREHASLQDDLTQTKLSPADRSLAERLLANGAWLVDSEDPLDEAERFQDLADRLMDKLEASGGTPSYAKLYTAVAQKGVKANVDKAEKRKEKKDERRELRMKDIRKRDAAQEDRLDAVQGKVKKVRSSKK